MDAQELALLILAGTIFTVILTILWIILPFAIFGIKPLLKQILAETREAKEIQKELWEGMGGLGRLVNKLIDQTKSLPSPPPSQKSDSVF